MVATVLCVGQAVQDFVFTLPTLPQAARKYPASHFESVGGGPAATAAAAIAQLGGRALLAARVGSDTVANSGATAWIVAPCDACPAASRRYRQS